MRAEIERSRADNAQLRRDVEGLAETCRLLRAHQNATDIRVNRHDVALDLAPAALPIGDEEMSIKEIAFETGYSTSGVRRWVQHGIVKSRKLGGAVLIDRRSIPEKVKKRGERFSNQA